MNQRIAIIGAGVLGSAIARQLSMEGASVTVIDPAPGQGASAGSLAWLNASFASDPVYNALRKDSLALWRNLQAQHPDLSVRFPGAILFSERDDDLAALTSPDGETSEGTRALSREDIETLEPSLATPPSQAVHCEADGLGDPASICAWFLKQAQAHGARLERTSATGIEIQANTVTGVQTQNGTIAAEHVILAAGIGISSLLEKLGLAVRMENQPGLSVRTAPLDTRIQHILSTPDGDLWQGQDGRILIANSPREGENTKNAATRTEHALGAMLGVKVAGDTITARDRPIPADGRPAVGPLGPDGLYVVSMHSGMTLAPVMASMVADELLNGTPDPRLAPYRPDRASLQGTE